MATKATAASAATKKPKAKLAAKSDTKSSKSSKTSKTSKASKSIKATKETKSKKTVEVKEKTKKSKPIELPKRPLTAWGLFFMDHLDKVKASGKSIVPTEETTNASVHWKQLSSSQKQPYEEKYKINFENYKKNLNQRLLELTPAEFKLENARRRALLAAGKKRQAPLKDPSAPKRPLSSFFRFAHDVRQSGKYSQLPLEDQARAFAAAWANVSEREKGRYQELSRAAIEKYKVEKATYLGEN
ncbi:exp1-like protein [Modicella reniformis]|uniref:Exp1-like protein n=1 Tax=Modicella reniformis TaxID=1440133 RepID=A0A9P6LSI0_9FUNG|nr:exp1-like protein [Modicella reniformis]